MNLPETQKVVIRQRGSNLQFIARAGSGKMQVATPRIIKLLTTCAKPGNIVVVTITDNQAPKN